MIKIKTQTRRCCTTTWVIAADTRIHRSSFITNAMPVLYNFSAAELLWIPCHLKKKKKKRNTLQNRRSRNKSLPSILMFILATFHRNKETSKLAIVWHHHIKKPEREIVMKKAPKTFQDRELQFTQKLIFISQKGSRQLACFPFLAGIPPEY